RPEAQNVFRQAAQIRRAALGPDHPELALSIMREAQYCIEAGRIDSGKLPDPKSVMGWSSAQYANALRHVESSPHYNPHFRQLLHVGFKVAAGMGKRFTDALEANEEIVGRNVTENLFDRHLQPIFR